MPLSREEFLSYIRAFNEKDYEKQYSFYHDDVALHIPDPQTGTLHGKEGIRGHFLPLFDQCEELIVPMVIISDGSNIFFIMESYFQYKIKMASAVFSHPVEVGDVIKLQVWAYFHLEDGKMKDIYLNLKSDQLLGQVDLREWMRESESRAEPDLRLFNY